MANITPIQLCNMALTLLGVEEEVENIDTPETRWEKRCAMFFEVSRINAITLLIPSFAITPKPVPITANSNGDFIIPSDCLRVLEVDGHTGNEIHEIGGMIITDFPIKDTIQVRYLKNISSTGLMPAEFFPEWANELAILLAPLTKDNSKITFANNVLIKNRQEFAGINAQKIKIKKKNSFPFRGHGFFYHS